MKISCEVILDLMPLVKDNIASPNSKALVLDHIRTCEQCREDFHSLSQLDMNKTKIDDNKVILSIKKNLYMTQGILLIVGTIIGIALTDTMGMFYNFIIMPLIGGIAFHFLKRKWIYVPIVIFVLSYIAGTVRIFISEGFILKYLYNGYIYLSLIYAGLVILGVFIGLLLKFAFSKEGIKNEENS